MLPTRGQLEGRMIVTAYEHGLDNVTEEAVSAVVYAVEVGLLGAERSFTGCMWRVRVWLSWYCGKRSTMSLWSQNCHHWRFLLGGETHPIADGCLHLTDGAFRKVTYDMTLPLDLMRNLSMREEFWRETMRVRMRKIPVTCLCCGREFEGCSTWYLNTGCLTTLSFIHSLYWLSYLTK